VDIEVVETVNGSDQTGGNRQGTSGEGSWKGSGEPRPLYTQTVPSHMMESQEEKTIPQSTWSLTGNLMRIRLTGPVSIQRHWLDKKPQESTTSP
jgi:hypothetical protein